MYQSILGLSTKLLHAYWVSGSAGPALVAEDHGQGHMSLKDARTSFFFVLRFF